MDVDDSALTTPGPDDFVEQIISNNVIHDCLFSYVTPLELFRLARTCRIAYGVVRFYVKRTFNVNRLLSRFFQDPVAFRSLQARTGMIFAGSIALQFFDRSFYPGSDLDVYLMREAMVEVTAWLVDVGYEFEPFPEQPPILQDAMKALMQNQAHEVMAGPGALAEHPLAP
ncbi:hypothetical protein EIP91_010303 [Steccherinum ochraceum]|uniref:F-box domain-containing protein n=1 Tax=Steccherinum ochraceum TaxID=92696 RepID=A0A4R0RX41_9APHY|nr:hypothetical protein EIP91_010303 [Steccherinum ochraceum]